MAAQQSAPERCNEQCFYVVVRLTSIYEGTWLDSESGLRNGKLPVPSNVTRISQAIKAKSSDGIPQIVYYEPGVGSTGTISNRIIGGATADGLSDNIRGGYSFIANNYAAADEIYLFGFSRGAFTVRSIAALIGAVGLLTKAGLPYLAEIFKDFENRRNPIYRPAYPDIPFPNKTSASNPKYQEELERVRDGILAQGVITHQI